MFRLIHKNQMILMSIWYHYCFYAWLDLVIAYDLFVLQIYIDDIIFGSTNQDFCEEFRKMMASEFEMSMIGEFSYFLGLQIKQMKMMAS